METSYRPENVRVEFHADGGMYGPNLRFLLVDFDGRPLQWFENDADAQAQRRNRAGVIRAALTRRANKAVAEMRADGLTDHGPGCDAACGCEFS